MYSKKNDKLDTFKILFVVMILSINNKMDLKK